MYTLYCHIIGWKSDVCNKNSDIHPDMQCECMAVSIIALVTWSCLCFCAWKWFLRFSYSWKSEPVITWWLASHRYRERERALDTHSTSVKIQAITTLIYFKQTLLPFMCLGQFELFWDRRRLVRDQFARFVVCALRFWMRHCFCIRKSHEDKKWRVHFPCDTEIMINFHPVCFTY